MAWIEFNMTYEYDKSIPEALLPLIKERFETVKDFFPGWCSVVTITYAPDNSNNYVLSCAPNYSYRFAEIVVYPLFFEDKTWFHTLLHELTHVCLAPFTHEVHALLHTMSFDEKTTDYIHHHLVNGEESVSQDLAVLIDKCIKL